MGKVFLDYMNLKTGELQYRYTLPNFKSFSYDLNTPVSPMPLPQANADKNILVKIEGNSGAIDLSWKILDNHSVNTVVSYGIDPDKNPPAVYDTIPSSTIREQINYFKDIFAPQDVSSNYQVVIRLSDTIAILPDNTDMVFKGTFTKFTFTMSDPELLTFKANAKFLQGEVVPLFAADTPSQPPNVKAVSSSAGRIDVIWDTPLEVGSSAITSYRIYWRIFNTQVEWDYMDTNSTSTTQTDISGSTDLPSGVYEVAIKAQSAAGFGNESWIDLVTVIGV